MDHKKRLTANAGAPVVDDQNVQTAGPRGPQLLQEVGFLEKITHFNHEVITERRMRAKGSGAFSTVTVMMTENNTPVGFHRDPLMFPDLNHVAKRDPHTNLRSSKNN